MATFTVTKALSRPPTYTMYTQQQPLHLQKEATTLSFLHYQNTKQSMLTL